MLCLQRRAVAPRPPCLRVVRHPPLQVGTDAWHWHVEPCVASVRLRVASRGWHSLPRLLSRGCNGSCPMPSMTLCRQGGPAPHHTAHLLRPRLVPTCYMLLCPRNCIATNTLSHQEGGPVLTVPSRPPRHRHRHNLIGLGTSWPPPLGPVRLLGNTPRSRIPNTLSKL